MAFQFSHEFHRNWLAAPKAERSRIKQDLSAIVDLLKPDTDLSSWQKKHGMYQKNTSAAEQVSLFDEPSELENAGIEEASAADQHESEQATSDFLKQVTQGAKNQPSTKEQTPPTIVESATAPSLNPTDIDLIVASLKPDIDTYIDNAFQQMKTEILLLLQQNNKRQQ